MLSRFEFHEKQKDFEEHILSIAWGVVDDTCLILLLDAVDKVSPPSRDPLPTRLIYQAPNRSWCGVNLCGVSLV